MNGGREAAGFFFAAEVVPAERGQRHRPPVPLDDELARAGDGSDPAAGEAVGRRSPRRQGEQQHVVLAPAQHQRLGIFLQHIAQLGEPRGRRQRRSVDHGTDPGGLAQPVEVERKAVRDVHHGADSNQPSEGPPQLELRFRQQVPAYRPAGGLGDGGWRGLELRRQDDPLAVETGAPLEQPLAGRRLAERAADPQLVAGGGGRAGEVGAAGGRLAQQGERGDDAVRAAGEIAAGERQAVPSAGGEEGLEEAPVVEAGRGRQGEEGVHRGGAGGGQVGQVDRQEPPRHQRRVEPGGEVYPLDLAVDGDRAGRRLGEASGVVAQQAAGALRAGEPAVELDLTRHRRRRGGRGPGRRPCARRTGR